MNIRTVVFGAIGAYGNFGRIYAVQTHGGNDEGSKFLPKVSIYPSYYTVSQPRRPQHEKYFVIPP